MDMVFQRYANPIDLMNMMIRNRRFREFTIEVVNFHNKDLEEKAAWEVWLHKVYDKSYGDFARSLKVNHETESRITKEEQTAIVRKSIDILSNFNIAEERNTDGDIQAIRKDSGGQF